MSNSTTSTDALSTLDAALLYAERGWAVFPLAPGTSVPMKGSNGFYDATTDHDTIRAWWNATPNANIGIRTGEASGIWALDFDGEEGQESLLRLYSYTDGEVDPERVVHTPKGGTHWYFKTVPGKRISNSVRKFMPGVDVRGEGGYVAAPPSKRPEGPYKTRLDGTPGLPPDDVVEEAIRASTRSSGGGGGGDGEPPTVEPGQGADLHVEHARSLAQAEPGTRNNLLNAYAYQLAGYCEHGELDEDDVRNDLEDAALRAGLSESEVRGTIASAFGAVKSKGYKLWDPGARVKRRIENRDDSLPVYSLSDVEDSKPDWLIKRFWPHPTHGQVGGMEKTMKTWVATAVALAVASGKPMFNHPRYPVVTQGAVAVFTGESGRGEFKRRLFHLGNSLYGMSKDELEQLPIFIIDKRATLTSLLFGNTLDQVLEQDDLKLVIVDPLYTYIGGDREVGNVASVGETLHAVSDKCHEAGVSTLIVHHFIKLAGGREPTITDLTQAGSREWVSSWALLWHRDKFDPATGTATLGVNIGSRHGYGAQDMWSLSVGHVNEDTFDLEGEVSFTYSEPDDDSESVEHVIKLEVRKKLEEDEHGWMTKSQIVEKVREHWPNGPTKPGKAKVENAILAMYRDKELRYERVPVPDASGRVSRRERYGLSGTNL